MAVAENPEVIVTISGEREPIVVSIDAPHLYELKIDRCAGDTANSFTLQVLDSVANDLEYNLLSSSGGDISVKYRGSSITTGSLNTTMNSFNGFITKMESSWYNDRNMLTLSGIIGISIQDKYEKSSFGWNKVPKFDWSNVFTDYKASGLSADRNEDDDFGEKFGDGFSSNVTGYLSAGLSYVFNGLRSLFGGYNAMQSIEAGTLSYYSPFTTMYSSVMTEDPTSSPADDYGPLKGYLKELSKALVQDPAGKFYFPKMDYSTGYYKKILDTGKAPTDKKYYVKQSGDYIIPMRPSSIVKLICSGGKFSDLIVKDEDFDKVYKDFNIYNGDATLSILDWVWIQVWFELMGEMEGLGINSDDVEETDMVEEDLSQNSQSYTDYIIKTLIPYSQKYVVEEIEDTSKAEITSDGNLELKYFNVTKTVYTNYMFSVDENKAAHFKRVSARDIYNNGPVASYYYYGTPMSNQMPHNKDSYGILQSFSATEDVLTAMISNGIDADGDISNINIVYGGEHKDSKEKVNPTSDEKKLHPFTGWGKVQVEYQGSSDSTKAMEVSLSSVQEQATAYAYMAKATIIGTSLLKPLDLISINVVCKDTKNAGGAYKHHTSGNYLIQKIEETVRNDGIVSSLTLIKNANNLASTAQGIKSQSSSVELRVVKTPQGKLKDIQEVQKYYRDLQNRMNGNNWKNTGTSALEWNAEPPTPPSWSAMQTFKEASEAEKTAALNALIKEEEGYDPSIQSPAKNPSYNKVPASIPNKNSNTQLNSYNNTLIVNDPISAGSKLKK